MNDATPLGTPDPAGAIRRGRKFDQVLAGARRVFLADGFEGASVDAIAREAGVSKATLYSYFPDKTRLFKEVARAECRLQIEEADAILAGDHAPARVLTVAAERMLDFFLSEFGRAVYRMCVAESDRFPELGREFYETGPKLIRERMCDYLRQAVEDGTLRIDDLALAADQFAELCKSSLFPELIFGVRKTATPAERARVVQGAVETFLARYGV